MLVAVLVSIIRYSGTPRWGESGPGNLSLFTSGTSKLNAIICLQPFELELNPTRKRFLTMTRSGYRILVASTTNHITTLFFDPHGPSLTVTSEIIVGPSPTWITGHPNDPSLVFTGLEQQDGVALALTFDDTGKGTIIGRIPSGGAGPASLLATPDALFVGNVSRVSSQSRAHGALFFLISFTWTAPRAWCGPNRSTSPGRSWPPLCPPRARTSSMVMISTPRRAQCCSSAVLAPTMTAKRARIRTTSWLSPDAASCSCPILAPIGRGASPMTIVEARSLCRAQSRMLLAADRGMPSSIVRPHPCLYTLLPRTNGAYARIRTHTQMTSCIPSTNSRVPSPRTAFLHSQPHPRSSARHRLSSSNQARSLATASPPSCCSHPNLRWTHATAVATARVMAAPPQHHSCM